MNSIGQNLIFLIVTAALLLLIFGILMAVGWKRNRAFQSDSNREQNYFSRPARIRDIVLLTDGTRVNLVESVDDGAQFLAETLPDYGKKAEKRTIAASDIAKIEYYGS